MSFSRRRARNMRILIPRVDLVWSRSAGRSIPAPKTRARWKFLLYLDRRVAFAETNRFHPPVILGGPSCNPDGEFRGVIVGYRAHESQRKRRRAPASRI